MSPLTPCRLVVAVVLLLIGRGAPAQLRLPSPPSLPPVVAPVLAPASALTERERAAVDSLAPRDLAALRRLRTEALLRTHPREIEGDPAGEPVVRGELLAMPSTAARRDAVLAAGVLIVREETIVELDQRWLIVRPQGGTLAEALARLRVLDPEGRYDYHHLYTGSGDTARAAGNPAATGSGESAVPAATTHRVGLIDAGIDASHPSLRAQAIRSAGCADLVPHPSPHGTAVASLLVGRDDKFRGAQPGAVLYAADVYCDLPTGGSVEAIARAFAWLVRERVGVVNVSLVGPANAVLERIVAAVVGRGMIVVAAVGNDGPSAAPLYPAAWPGVVAVTATDARRRLLAEVGRGAHVMFAAPGADLAAAASRDPRYVLVRGTSFAAPIVAGLLAARLDGPDPVAARSALAALAAEAIDLGAPGRDAGYGFGLVGDSLRVDPGAVTLATLR